MKKLDLPKKILIILSLMLVIVASLLGCAALGHKETSEESGEVVVVSTTLATTTETTTETESTTPADTTPPVITGVKDKVVHIGETVAYKKGVEVTDDTDPSPKLEVDADGVDVSKEGEYTVIYRATDASGNSVTAAATIKVVPQESISTDQANALADDVLARIVTEDMTDSEKLDAVWWYIHELGYVDVDYGEPEEYLDNAYYFITRMMGNCRCVYATARLLLERLGWDCMMICNKEDAAQTHYWNLVSLDGGETWYHFDPICWGWEEEYVICMVSDEWILAYSEWHNMETYDWEIEDYPATPEENWDPDGYFGDRMLFDNTGFYGSYYGWDYNGPSYSGGSYYNGNFYSDYYFDEDYYQTYYYEEEYYEDDYYEEEYYEEEYYDEEYTGENDDYEYSGEESGDEYSDEESGDGYTDNEAEA